MLTLPKNKVKLDKEEYAYIEAGSGETVILVHGNMSSSVHYMPLIERLQEHYHLIALDLRGFGDSSYNNSYNSMDELADDLDQFMTAKACENAFFVCWSAGCCVTLKFASKYPNRVKKIFAIEGGSHRGYPIFQKDKSFQSVYGKVYETKQELSYDPVQVAPVQNMLATHNVAGMSAVWDSVIYTVNKPSKEDGDIYMQETMKQRCLVDLDWSLCNINMSNEYSAYAKGDGSIENVNCSCTFTSADKDLTVPPWMVMENVNGLGSKAKLLPYIDCGHSPLVDCPDKLAEDIKNSFEE